MKIAYTMTEGKGDLDLVLHRFATSQEAAGKRVCGVVQINTDRDNCVKCDMDVQVLPDGALIRISQNLGKDARGCRLDVNGLEQAVGEVEARLDATVDLLVINKFGKHEASGRGFRNVIGRAIELGVPVVCGVNPLNQEPFQEFCGGAAEFVKADADTLSAWLST